ncbi:hypothetical protein L6164_028390 [Bauhinia variegata]|uniref:Uncharacterized protein n=1 Tax=Bauhinia variegata TaxID=167791 RepID=A0ACB9L5Y3_BAUVA|nr:hypothetical protein L6164_028390 [Bauhinia variegata]
MNENGLKLPIETNQVHCCCTSWRSSPLPLRWCLCTLASIPPYLELGTASTEIREHVLCDRFCKSYTRWIWHGEQLEMPSMFQREEVDVDVDDQLDDMIRDIGAKSFE